MMEKEFYTDEFEQLLKEKADQFRMYPSKRVWHSIYNNLHPSRRWPSVVMSLLLISSLSLIGYLNTGDNKITQQINNTSFNETTVTREIAPEQKNSNKNQSISFTAEKQQPETVYSNAFEDIITAETDFHNYTVVKSNRPDYTYKSGTITEAVATTPVTVETTQTGDDNANNLIQSVDTYIKSNKIFSDIAAANKKNKINTTKTTAGNRAGETKLNNAETEAASIKTNPATEMNSTAKTDQSKITEVDKKVAIKLTPEAATSLLSDEDKAWIENYAMQNKSSAKKWKDRLSYQFYITPAVNYRKLTTKSKGSTSAFANADINDVISQKPGFGFEAGAGLTYTIAKRLQLKAGLQFNYTNYNIAADQTNHPVTTTILLNDLNTGYSYSAARTTTTSNPFNSSALQPVTLHNRTYQVSLPVGFAYKISSEQNVDWFAGASIQPTYVFGGNAHIISSDLKSYVSDPSSIRTWNLNLGFETYMNFKLGSYNLQVGPQVRYQVYSTYRRDIALIEKPYAVGLKFGLTKGF